MTLNGQCQDTLERLHALHIIGIALAAEKDGRRLQEMILKSAKELTDADGGTLYLRTRDGKGDALSFEIMMTDSLGIYQGGVSGQAITYPSVPLHDTDGQPNLHMVATCATLTGQTINIPDAYENTRFEFSGTQRFDQHSGYHSKAFLTVPMKDHNDRVIGVLQLINPIDSQSGQIKSFSNADQQLVESLAAQATVALLNQRLLEKQRRMFELFKELNQVGVALSYEKDNRMLLNTILETALNLTHADAGTLYLAGGEGKEKKLYFEILITRSKEIHLIADTDAPLPIPPLSMYDAEGKPNTHMVAVCAALEKKLINIADAYENTEFEFSGTKAFDAKNQYRSKSFLTVPMLDRGGELLGVLQLINALDPESGEIQPFSDREQELIESLTSQAALVESLASQAAVAITNQRLLEEQKHLFEAFITLIAGAIDEKSPYTGGHCRRVPELTMLLADAVIKTQHGSEEIRNFGMNAAERYELWVAGMLHDCGKITTPVHVMDKSTKLETIYDRIHAIDTRFEVLKRDAEIALLRQQVAALERGETPDGKVLDAALEDRVRQLNEDRDFLRKCNVGGEFMAEAMQQRVIAIAQRRWRGPDGQAQVLLTEEEIENLNIAKGTLTAKEREIINYHITATINMLESLPFPKHLQRVAEYAGGHHEHMDGQGYPKGLKRADMSLPARIMGIADIFEALTASDRPYKKAMPVSIALNILGKMKLENHIDPDLFDVFVREKVYLSYARRYLSPGQIDAVDERKIPGYNPLQAAPE